MSLDITLIEETVLLCPHCSKEIDVNTKDLWENNITHNLARMADEVGLYTVIWECKQGTQAKTIIPELIKGIALLKLDPDKYRVFDAKNGWGKYENLIEFFESFLDACKSLPESYIKISK